jgi:hypothetical protein
MASWHAFYIYLLHIIWHDKIIWKTRHSLKREAQVYDDFEEKETRLNGNEGDNRNFKKY